MKLTPEEKSNLEKIYNELLNDPRIKKMQDIPMHRGSNCYIHSFKVAKRAIKRGMRHRNINLQSMLIASILHDYYLYDWRTDKKMKKHHGKNHPFLAAENAKKDFNINEDVEHIIKSHMWPINFKTFPTTKEARIVGLTDTHIAFIEALFPKCWKKRRQQKYLDSIQKLF